MSEMIERVAKAMAKADAHNAAWKLYEREAVAAIEAMREPTEAMKKLMAASDVKWLPDFWEAMIDEALK
jgi:glutathionylspermidine synthase